MDICRVGSAPSAGPPHAVPHPFLFSFPPSSAESQPRGLCTAVSSSWTMSSPLRTSLILSLFPALGTVGVLVARLIDSVSPARLCSHSPRTEPHQTGSQLHLRTGPGAEQVPTALWGLGPGQRPTARAESVWAPGTYPLPSLGSVSPQGK